MTVLDRAALRAEVGSQNFERLESLIAVLCELESRQIISSETASLVSLALAEDIAAQAIAREIARESLLVSGGRA